MGAETQSSTFQSWGNNALDAITKLANVAGGVARDWSTFLDSKTARKVALAQQSTPAAQQQPVSSGFPITSPEGVKKIAMYVGVTGAVVLAGLALYKAVK